MSLFTFIAILSYIFAPKEYSFSFCLVLNLLYIATSIYIGVKDKFRDFPSYHFLFSISFYCVNFVYPVFVFPIDPNFSLFSLSHYSFDIISRCTSLAYLAYCIYGIGYLAQINKFKNFNVFKQLIIKPDAVNKTVLWTNIVFGLTVISGGLAFFSDQYRGVDSGSVSVFAKYLLVCLPAFLLVLSVSYKFCENSLVRKKILITTLAISIIIVLTGARTIPLFALIVIGYVLVSVHHIKKVNVIAAMAIGVIFMSVIGEIRHSVIEVSNIAVVDPEISGLGYVEYISDLFICNRNLYAAFDIVDKESCTWGVSLLAPLLSPIPFLQSAIVYIFQIPADNLGSATYLSVKELGSIRTLGLGSNIVADVYLAFGVAGFILFYYLGKIVVYSRYMMRKNSFIWSIVYVALLGDAIYACRSSIFGDFRLILWAILLSYIFYKKQNVI